MYKGGGAMERISIVHGPYDDDLHEIDTGYLVAERDAMYIADGKLWYLRVNRTDKENVYTQGSGHLLLGEADRSDEESVIREVMELLNGMTAFEFLTRYIINSEYAIELDLIK
jgi:hypothetical protein